MVETPIFIPYTADSNLKRKLQELDDKVGEATGSPAARFVERCGGGTIIDLLGRTNPWAKDWACDRKECLICKGRCLLAGEEEARPAPEPGNEPLPRQHVVVAQ